MNAPSEDIIKKEIYLYQILNKVDGKFYLGTTCDIDRRWKEHKRSLSQGTHHSIYLQRAWNKYGQDSFQFKVIKKIIKQRRKEIEQYFLNKFQCYNPSIGYNMNKKVDSRYGRPMSDEAKKKISLSKKGKPSARKGVKASEETRKKLSTSHKGQKAWHKGKTGVYSEETRKKMGVHRKGCVAWGNGIKGKSVAWNKGLSKETDERIAKSANSKEIRLKRSIAVKEWWKHKKQKQNECA